MTRGGAVRWLLGIALVLVAALLALRVVLQPQRLTRYALGALGDALGLDITATGVGEYRLRGSPVLVARDVVARVPNSQVPVLRAQRVLVQVPWSTLRSRGAVLDIERIELDRPRLDAGALQRWLAARPSGDGGLPTLRRGLQVRAGRIDGDGWSLRQLDVDLPRLHAAQPVAARVRGLAIAGTGVARAGFDLALALTQPANGAGVAAFGAVTAVHGDLVVPTQVRASGHVLSRAGMVQVAPIRLAVGGTARGGDFQLAFATALDGTARLADDGWTLGPASLVVRGADPVPLLDARGRVRSAAGVLGIALDGRIARWPASWPAVPPLSASAAPVAFRLGYDGAPALSDPAQLRLAWGGATADVAFRLPDMVSWSGAASLGTPLPPLTGHARVPVLEVSGAVLEGVDIVFDREPADAGATP